MHRVVVLLIKPIVFLTFSLLSASLDLKVSICQIGHFHTRDGLSIWDRQSIIKIRQNWRKKRWINWVVHPKFRPFDFQIKTYYLSDANYPTDNPSQKDNPSLAWIGPLTHIMVYFPLLFISTAINFFFFSYTTEWKTLVKILLWDRKKENYHPGTKTLLWRRYMSKLMRIIETKCVYWATKDKNNI